MKKISTGKFKTQCLTLIDEVAQTHEPIIITKYGKPMVKVIPFESTKDTDHEPLKETATFIDDIISPINEEWEANK